MTSMKIHLKYQSYSAQQNIKFVVEISFEINHLGDAIINTRLVIVNIDG